MRGTRLTGIILWLITLCLLVGCVTVDKSRFAALKESLQTLNKGAEDTYSGVSSLQAQHLAQVAKETELFPATIGEYLIRQGKLSATDAKMNKNRLPTNGTQSLYCFSPIWSVAMP